jgi:hypothetical protein
MNEKKKERKKRESEKVRKKERKFTNRKFQGFLYSQKDKDIHCKFTLQHRKIQYPNLWGMNNPTSFQQQPLHSLSGTDRKPPSLHEAHPQRSLQSGIDTHKSNALQ